MPWGAGGRSNFFEILTANPSSYEYPPIHKTLGRTTLKVFIAGATGVLGRRLIRQFRERGHSVIGMARSTENENMIRKLGGESRRADLFDADSLARAAEGADVVVHAATSIPTKTKPDRRIGKPTIASGAMARERWRKPRAEWAQDSFWCKASPGWRVRNINRPSTRIHRRTRISLRARRWRWKRLRETQPTKKDSRRQFCAADGFTLLTLRTRVTSARSS